jgi:hypothetical protein
MNTSARILVKEGIRSKVKNEKGYVLEGSWESDDLVVVDDWLAQISTNSPYTSTGSVRGVILTVA